MAVAIGVVVVVVFFVLGIIQLSLLMHARLMAHFAAFKAARAGSVNHGDCVRMTQAALAGIIPSVSSFMAPGIGTGGTPAERYVGAFTALRERLLYKEFAAGVTVIVDAEGDEIVFRSVEGFEPPPVELAEAEAM